MTFPDGFWWGTASSSTQCEGAAPTSDWARWERLGKAPPSGEGNGFATNFREDFGALAEHGIAHHRLVLEWARLEPREREHDHEAVEHYLAVLEAARDVGVSVWVCLHHGSLPGWFSEDSGGFLDDRGRSYHWPRHVDFVAETFGDLVAGWEPIHDPEGYVRRAWLEGTAPPGRTSEEDAAKASHAVELAQVEAANQLRGGPPVATAYAHPLLRDGMDVERWADDLGAGLQQFAEAHPEEPLTVSTLGVGTDDDDRRTQALGAARDQVAATIEAGVDLRGVFWWTAVDGYEEHDGFALHCGLFDRDRHPRPSAALLSALSRQ